MKKEIVFPILKYYLFFVLIPVCLAFLFGYLGSQALPTLLYDFVIFVSPFLFFFIPYRKIKNKIKNVGLTVFLSFVVPFLCIYSFTAWLVFKSLEHFGS